MHVLWWLNVSVCEYILHNRAARKNRTRDARPTVFYGVWRFICLSSAKLRNVKLSLFRLEVCSVPTLTGGFLIAGGVWLLGTFATSLPWQYFGCHKSSAFSPPTSVAIYIVIQTLRHLVVSSGMTSIHQVGIHHYRSLCECHWSFIWWPAVRAQLSPKTGDPNHLNNSIIWNVCSSCHWHIFFHWKSEREEFQHWFCNTRHTGWLWLWRWLWHRMALLRSTGVTDKTKL